MKTVLPAEREVMTEAVRVLLAHLSPSKAARALSWIQSGAGDYVALRDRLFREASMKALVDGIRDAERSGGGTRSRTPRSRQARSS